VESWKLSDSCHQHALHQVDTYFWGWRNIRTCSALVIEGGSLGVWVSGVMYVVRRMFVLDTKHSPLPSGTIFLYWIMFVFFGLSQYCDQGSSAFFSCALTVNVIGLLFLRQCFGVLPPSTQTSISGTSRKLPLCNLVSQYV
jgi:hypothetical protein